MKMKINSMMEQQYNPCSDMGHEYADINCPECGRDFCYSCANSNNMGQAYTDINSVYMSCPVCGAMVRDHDQEVIGHDTIKPINKYPKKTWGEICKDINA